LVKISPEIFQNGNILSLFLKHCSTEIFDYWNSSITVYRSKTCIHSAIPNSFWRKAYKNMKFRDLIRLLTAVTEVTNDSNWRNLSSKFLRYSMTLLSSSIFTFHNKVQLFASLLELIKKAPLSMPSNFKSISKVIGAVKKFL